MPPANVVNRFLREYLADIDAGRTPGRTDYIARYPGFEAEIAEAWEAMQASSVGARTGAGCSTPAGILDAGRMIGSYRIVREIGRGGQGVVFLAEDTRLGRRVALKVLTRLGSSQDRALARFGREARIASHLDDPGICTVYETGIADGIPFIAMRFVDGETLDGHVSRWSAAGARGPDAQVSGRDGATPVSAPVPLVTKLRVVERVARAVHRAHEAGIIHRDLKPRNIVITPRGDPVILDFGLACEVDPSEPAITVSGGIFGTPAYMSPEQLGGEAMRADVRTDVWALGVLLYEVVTGAKPFSAPTMEALCDAVRTTRPPDPRRFDRSVSRDLAAVIETALEPDRGRRYRLAAALADDLGALIEGRPTVARPLGRLAKFARWCRREKALAVTLAGALTVVILVALLVYVRGVRQMRREARELLAEANRKAREYAEARAVPAAFQERVRLCHSDMDWGAPFESPMKREYIDVLAGLERAVLRIQELAADAENAFAVARAKADLPEIHEAQLRFLSELYVNAEAERNEASLIRLRAQLVGTPAAGVLDPRGSITIETDPAGAEVTAYPVVPAWGGRLAEDRGAAVLLGTTPLRRVPMAAGSWILILKSPGRRDTRYPVVVERDRDRTAPDGFPIRLLSDEQIGGDEWVYVPRTWAVIGGGFAENAEAARTLWLGGFCMMRHEVTNGEYARFLNDPGIRAEIARRRAAKEVAALVPRSDARQYLWSERPDGSWVWPAVEGLEASGAARIAVGDVSWHDANAYAAWLSHRDGRRYRLPTEWEWELAARGADGRPFPWGHAFEWSYFCGLRSCARPLDVPVEQFAVDCSPFGIRDMTGSRWEWCANQYELERDPINGARQVKGGAAMCGANQQYRAAYRAGSHPDCVYCNNGFRLVFDP